MASPDKKAEEYMAQAEKKLKSSQGFIGSLFGGSSKVDEAIELYIKAANSFKMSKNWIAAGRAFCEAAKVNLQQNVKHEAASNYNDAATCYKKADANEAVNCLLKSVEIYTDMGRFSIAAKQHVAIAETYESELEDKDKAIQHFEQAADYYQGEESSSHANKCLLKVAEMSALLERYEKALEIYERVAKQCADNNLLKYTARDHLFRAGVCRMCLDNEDAKQSIAKYEAMVPQFADSRECKLLKTLTTAVEEGNADSFTAALQEWDAMTKFDPWFTTLFLRVKKHHLSGQDDLK